MNVPNEGHSSRWSLHEVLRQGLTVSLRAKTTYRPVENVKALLSWTSRDKLSWSHRDAAHISEGHLLRYACSRTCDVHNVVHNAGMSLPGGNEPCHRQHCIA